MPRWLITAVLFSLSRTLQSVEQQTYPDYEIIIIHGGSTDGTKEFLDNDKNNKNNVVVFNQENKGVSAASEFICFLDSDDTYEPTFLEKMINLQQETDADVIYCDFNYIDRKGHIDIRKNTISQSTLQKYLSGSMFHLSCMLINKNSLLIKK